MAHLVKGAEARISSQCSEMNVEAQLSPLTAREGGGTNIKRLHTSSYSHKAEQPKANQYPHPPRTILLSAQPSPLFTMNKYDPDTDYMIIPTTTVVESPAATTAESPTTMISESPTTMIPESPTTNIGEIPIHSAITGREADSVFEGCQAEGRRYIASSNEVPPSAVLEASYTEGHGGIAKIPPSEPLCGSPSLPR